MSEKLTTPGFFKRSYFEIQVMTSKFLAMVSTTKLYHLTQTILQIWSVGQSFLTLALL